MLQAGGSAVDAAVAANAALGLMEPTGNGIGGDLFAIVWDPKAKQLYGYNGSGRAPMGRSLDELREAIAAMKARAEFPRIMWASHPTARCRLPCRALWMGGLHCMNDGVVCQ